MPSLRGAHGIADTVNFGHVKLTDDPNQFVENGLAITPSALKNAFDNYQPPIPKIPDAASFTKGINTMQPQEDYLRIWWTGGDWPINDIFWCRQYGGEIDTEWGDLVSIESPTSKKIITQFYFNNKQEEELETIPAPYDCEVTISYYIDADSDKYVSLLLDGVEILKQYGQSTSTTGELTGNQYEALLTTVGTYSVKRGSRFTLSSVNNASTLIYGQNCALIRFEVKLLEPIDKDENDVQGSMNRWRNMAATYNQLYNFQQAVRDDLKARWIYDAGTYTGKGTSDRVVETDLFDDIAFLIIWPRSEDIDGSYTYSYPFYAEYISSSETTYYQNTCFSYSNKGATIEGDPYVTILPGGVFVVHPEVEAYHSADRNRTIGCVNQKSHTYQWIAFGIGPYSLEEGEW